MCTLPISWYYLPVLGDPTSCVKCVFPHQSLRRGSSVFAGKHGFITLRDLFRWAERYRLDERTDASQDWLQHLADDGEACQTCLLSHQLTTVFH